MDNVLLLVDDEPNILAALSRLFRRDGYRILTASNGQDALELLAHEPVAVVISDQRMPGMTGAELLGQVKDIRPDTVRIILSGYTELTSVTDAINRGAVFRFLTKPWEDDLLREQVREAFRHYKLGHENERLTAALLDANAELSTVNAELERRVEAKAREVITNIGTLRIAQEILDQLPIGVVGIADDGLVVMANQLATSLIDSGPLTGMMAQQVLPGDILNCWRQGCAQPWLAELKGLPVRLECHRLGKTSLGQGLIMLLMPERT